MSIGLDIVEAIDGEGSYAAIRVTGLDDVDVPVDPTFRIEPIDDALTVDAGTDWPAGPRRPASIKIGDGVVDLVLGPDVLESALLLPGTPVTISVSGTPLSVELVWPSITLRQPRPRRPVIVTEQLRHEERDATESKRREAAAVLAAATARVRATEGNAAERITTRRTGTSPAAGLAREAGGRVLSGFTQPKQTDTTAAALIRLEGGRSAALPGTALTAVTLKAPARAKPRLVRQIAAFGSGLAVAAALVFSLVSFRVIDIYPVGKVAGGTPDVALTLARNSHTLRSVLSTGGISPRGRATNGVDGASALRAADAHLHGTGQVPRDQGEASFWLRHALSQPIDHDSMKWAYTQLGSLYAQPDGFAPDYAKARLLWEIAGALGDPVALCFNAALYEHGLGVPKHRDLARALYERARGAGGCRGVDEALKRTN